jgi:uncharacterized protein DUF2125
MSVSLVRGCGAAFVFCVAASSVSADVNAQDVWADWKSYLSGVGYAITGDESQSGGTLTVKDVTMSMTLPEQEGDVSFSISEMTFQENGDGTVNVAFPAEFPINFDVQVEGDDSVQGSLLYKHNGTTMVVSGSPEDMITSYASAMTSVTLGSIVVDGEAIPADVARFNMVMEGIVGQTRMTMADMRAYAQTMTASAVSYDFAFDDPDSDDQGVFTGALQGLSFEGTSTVPATMTAGDMAQMLRDGFAFDGSFAYSSGNGSINGTGDGESFGIQTSSTGGEIGVAMDASRLSYDVQQSGANMSIATPDLPFPVNLSMADAAFKLDMPVGKSDEEQPFAMAIRLGEFSVPDELWGMFDPAAVLPRGPASVILDMSGRAKVLFDLMDPESMAAVETGQAAPGELNALTVNELLVSAAGTELTGTGDFTFDNDDLASYDGMPAPMGTANLSLSGANGLLDKLIQMGVMSDSDAMGARMMMGMLAVPGEAPDTLTSVIEFAPGGQILANGQRIK